MHPKNEEQLSALKAFAKALKVDFETSPYNSAFVAKVRKSKVEADQGKFTTLDPNKSVWESIE